MAEIRVAKQNALKTLTAVIIAGMYAFVSFEDGQATGRLRITSIQRNALAKEIERKFGLNVRGGIKAGQPAVLAGAAAMHAFVTDGNWRSAHERR
jgi:hypothetical protein